MGPSHGRRGLLPGAVRAAGAVREGEPCQLRVLRRGQQAGERRPQRGPATGRFPEPDLQYAQGLRSECPVFRAGAETGVQLHGRCQSASWLSDGQPQGLACLCTVLCLLSFLNSSEHLPRNLPG